MIGDTRRIGGNEHGHMDPCSDEEQAIYPSINNGRDGTRSGGREAEEKESRVAGWCHRPSTARRVIVNADFRVEI